MRPNLTINAAKLYFHSMIMSHFLYCATVWGQSNQSALSGVKSLYKQALKVLDQKPMRWHHCKILEKHSLLSFENFLNHSFLKLVFKCVTGLAPESVSSIIQRSQTRGMTTRGVANGDCRTARCKTAFGRSAFSVKGPQIWNTLPAELKHLTDLNEFNCKIKRWLKSKQNCEHY